MCELLTKRMPGSRHKPGVPALGNHTLKCFDGPRVVRLQAELVGRHSADSWAGVNQHPLDQRSDDINGERAGSSRRPPSPACSACRKCRRAPDSHYQWASPSLLPR